MYLRELILECEKYDGQKLYEKAYISDDRIDRLLS